ncbi:MAG: hypothetical protein IJS00_02910 [Paludibacteraceae bacterium]|nr:hypothetical protein [Paludibacteraceae bacterium]
MEDIVQYIISFLLYGDNEHTSLIGYTNDPAEWDKYELVILPNGHLGKDWVMPYLSTPTRERKFITPDLVYNTAFFISRAEELINTKRDEHGRFAAKDSILGEQNRLMIPVIDEYARFTIKALERVLGEKEQPCPVTLPKNGFSDIYLTHDIDTIEHYRHLRGFVGGLFRGQWAQACNALKELKRDPAYTFPWIVEQDKKAAQATPVYFVKDTPGYGYDYPQYNLHGKDYQRLQQLLKQNNALIGWHSSYYGEFPTNIAVPHNLHRSHYLNGDIDTMQRLIDCGVTDDFTMGFADQAGFRLQTTRPVKWLNPKTMQLTSLTLHPLTVMDVTLSEEKYMHLNEDEAYFYCQRLFEKVWQNSGELTLLWHNTSINPNTYHKNLYPKLLQLI